MDWFQSTWQMLQGFDEEILRFASERTVLFYTLYCASLFAETGLVVAPFLPSETLVFSLGALASEDHQVDPWLGGVLAAGATLLGDFVNMLLGRTLGRRFLAEREGRILGERSVRWSERYFERYGPRTVFICRFLPLLRTAAPFLAGMGEMRIRTFLAFNASSAVVWSSLFVAAGYFFGQISFVERNFPLVIALVAFVALVPAVAQFWHQRRMKGGEDSGPADS